MNTIIIILRIVSFVTAMVISTLLIGMINKYRNEKKRLRLKINGIDYLNDEVGANYIVLVFDNSEEKDKFISNIGGDTKFNTFHVRCKDNIELRSKKEQASDKVDEDDKRVRANQTLEDQQ